MTGHILSEKFPAVSPKYGLKRNKNRIKRKHVEEIEKLQHRTIHHLFGYTDYIERNLTNNNQTVQTLHNRYLLRQNNTAVFEEFLRVNLKVGSRTMFKIKIWKVLPDL